MAGLGEAQRMLEMQFTQSFRTGNIIIGKYLKILVKNTTTKVSGEKQDTFKNLPLVKKLVKMISS